MGLGGRREKQVIAADPRNTRWINDTSSPGHRLLTSMGYDPSNGNASDNKTGLYGHNSTKRLRAIPVAKAGMEGIGFKPNGPGANVALGALPSRGGTTGPGSVASAASNIFAKLGSRAALQFVTAGASKEVINRSRTEGGEFGGLLARLNAASATPEATEDDEADSANEQPVASGSSSQARQVVDEDVALGTSSGSDCDSEERQRKRQRKLEKAAKKERKLAKKLAKLSASASAEQSAESGTDTSASVAASPGAANSTPSGVSLPQENVRRIAHWNASRSRNLASKRMLHASADALAEILGVAPTPSPSVSGYSTPTSLPATIAPSTSVSKAPSPAPMLEESASETRSDKTDKKAEKLARKLARKQAKSLAVEDATSGTDVTASETDATNSELEKKKRKRVE